MTCCRRLAISCTSRSGSESGEPTIAHIDPYDPRAVGTAGLSSVDLARELIDRRVGVIYWYGYDRPERRWWALDELAEAAHGTMWCGDIMVAAHGAGSAGGDLGVATTPGTGFGIVCANVSDAATEACQRLGEALAVAYDGVPLPDERPGHLEFTTRTNS